MQPKKLTCVCDQTNHAQQSVSLPCLAGFKAHDKDINDTDVSPDDSMICTASQDKTLRLYSITFRLGGATGKNGKRIRPSAAALTLHGVLRGHRRGVWSTTFSPSARTVCSASGDRTVRIWNIDSLQCVRALEGHSASVLRACFLPSGEQVMSSAADGLIKLWDLGTGEVVTTLDRHDERVWALAVGEVHEVEVVGDDGADGGEEKKGGAAVAAAAAAAAATNGAAEAKSSAAVTVGGTNTRLRLRQTVKMVSGGADSRVVVWRDATTEQALNDAAAAEKRTEQRQKLENLFFAGEWDRAFKAALELEFPRKLLDIVSAIVKKALAHASAETGGAAANGGALVNAQAQSVQSALRSALDALTDDVDGKDDTGDDEDEEMADVGATKELSDAQREQRSLLVGRLLRYARSWNTNSRTSSVAQGVSVDLRYSIVLFALPFITALTPQRVLRNTRSSRQSCRRILPLWSRASRSRPLSFLCCSPTLSATLRGSSDSSRVHISSTLLSTEWRS